MTKRHADCVANVCREIHRLLQPNAVFQICGRHAEHRSRGYKVGHRASRGGDINRVVVGGVGGVRYPVPPGEDSRAVHRNAGAYQEIVGREVHAARIRRRADKARAAACTRHTAAGGGAPRAAVVVVVDGGPVTQTRFKPLAIRQAVNDRLSQQCQSGQAAQHYS